MADSVMLNKAKDFAVDIVYLCREIKHSKHETVLANQLLRAATSVGANIHESKYASSLADFAAKMQIALKECYEAEYWLEILGRTNCICADDFTKYTSQCGQIRRMLISSINTTKNNKAGKTEA